MENNKNALYKQNESEKVKKLNMKIKFSEILNTSYPNM